MSPQDEDRLKFDGSNNWIIASESTLMIEIPSIDSYMLSSLPRHIAAMTKVARSLLLYPERVNLEVLKSFWDDHV